MLHTFSKIIDNNNICVLLKLEDCYYIYKLDLPNQPLINNNNVFKILEKVNNKTYFYDDGFECYLTINKCNDTCKVCFKFRFSHDLFKIENTVDMVFIKVTDTLSTLNYKLNELSKVLSESDLQKQFERDADEKILKMSLFEMFCA